MIDAPVGDLARCKTHEANQDFPPILEIVAYDDPSGLRRGNRRIIQITADRFFGRGRYSAPLTGAELLAMVDQLRRRPVPHKKRR
jgi:hypothetical protein